MCWKLGSLSGRADLKMPFQGVTRPRIWLRLIGRAGNSRNCSVQSLRKTAHPHSPISGTPIHVRRGRAGFGSDDRPVCPPLPTSCCIALNRRCGPQSGHVGHSSEIAVFVVCPSRMGEATNAVRGAPVSVGSVTNRWRPRNQLRHSPLTTMRRTTPMICRFTMPYRHCNVLRLKIDADQGSNEYHWYQ